MGRAPMAVTNADEIKPDVVLSDGKEITFDLRKIKISEYRELFEDNHPYDDEVELMARVSGIDVDAIRDLSLYDHKKLWRAFFDVCQQPLRDPNS